MASKKEVSVEEKLRALYDLQLIDSRIDEIRNVRGELPLEVSDLENEINGLEEKLTNFDNEISDYEFQSKEQKNLIEVAKENLLTVIDGWSVSYLAGMWKGVEEDSVEISIVCNVDKSKEVVQIILQAASELGEETIMIGNNFIQVQ